MQCTSFLPGCYSSRDLNVGANGGAWPLYNERPLISGHSYNVFLPLPTKDQFLVNDKEVLRQTMLKHESIFREQVQELHRLYRRQRELMDELKRRELSKQNIHLHTSQFNSFSPKVSSESPQKMRQVSSLPWVNPATTRLSISSAENFQSASIISLWEGKAGLDTTPIEDNLIDCKLSRSKYEKPKKKMLDLELPADEYIDSEEEDWSGEDKVSKVPELPRYPPKKMPKVSQNSDLKLFPCGGLLNPICQGGGSSPDTVSRRTNDLADLNEPVIEDAMASNTAINLLGSETYHKGITSQDHELLGKSNSGFQGFSKEIVSCIQTRRAVEACLKSKHPEDGKQELLPCNDEAGQSVCNLNPLAQVSTSAKLPMPIKQLKVELPAEFSAFNLLGECERKLQNQRTNSVRETSERNHDLSNDDYRRLASSSLPISYQLVPQSDLAKSEPSSVSSQRKPTRNIRQNPIAVQALPCFNIAVPSSKSTKSAVASPPLNGNRFHGSINLRCSTGVESLSPLRNSFCIGSQSDSTVPLIGSNHLNCSTANRRYVNPAKAMDLNMPPSCLLDSEVSQLNIETEDGVKKLEDSRAVSARCSEKPDYSNKHNEEREDLTQTDLVVSQASPTSVCDAQPKKFMTSDCAGNEKILWSSNFVEPHVSIEKFCDPASSSNSHPNAYEDKDIKSNQKAGLHDINSGKQCTTYDVSKDIIVDRKLLGVENQIDLNSGINEDESSPTLLIPKVIIKTMAEIDLEAPVSPENKECSPPRGESEENQIETPIKLSQQGDRDQKDELVRMAAEAIVLISTHGVQKLFLENTVHETLEPSRCDSLHWFAGIVSSVAIDLENEAGVVLSGEDGGNLSSDGSDYFETMTLELNETNWCKRYSQEEKETGPVLSPSQPRRGRARRGRQRKDFLSEVLPSLASLSRHEVTEDLQAIGGLAEAADFSVETSLGRRNAGRNACSRARRRSGNSFCHGMEKTVCSPLKSWGKINRRQRGPRIATTNPRLIFS